MKTFIFNNFGKISILILSIFIIFASSSVVVNESAKDVIDRSFNQALIVFGSAKALNAVISLAQGTEINLPFVVVAIGEVLDPINDLVEQFSLIMLASLVSLGGSMPQMIVDAPQLEQLKQKVKNLGEKLAAYGGTARMVILVVGGAPIVRAQAQTKVKLGAELGVTVEIQELPTHTSVNSLLKTVRRLNGDQDVDGIYLEPPLPHHLAIINPLDEIVPEKDVTGYHPFNLGRILAGDEPVEIYPLLPKACLNLLANEELRDSRVVIIGRHPQICRPLAQIGRAHV